MTNYLTLTINEEVLMNVLSVMVIFFFVLGIISLLDMIEEEQKRKEKRRKRNIAKPYYDKYQELVSQEKYEEALEYRKQNKKYINYFDLDYLGYY